MAKTLDTVLLLALPASGKSEVRKYLAELSPQECQSSFHMGETVQLDDYPYVHLMRCVDDELAALGKERVFFKAPDSSFQHSKDWGTLIELVNEDYQDLVERKYHKPSSVGEYLFERLDKASSKSGAPVRLAKLDKETRAALAQNIEGEAKKMLDDKHAGYPDTLDGKTLVIEFARGGADGAAMPLEGGFGYAHSLKTLSPAILEKASILYIWVTPEESRRKNAERTDPNDPGSILHHGVPIEVLMNDYGCDDMSWLEENSKVPEAVTLEAHGQTFHLPIARFDNRVDKTSFIRNDKGDWKTEEVEAVHGGLKNALTKLANFNLA